MKRALALAILIALSCRAHAEFSMDSPGNTDAVATTSGATPGSRQAPTHRPHPRRRLYLSSPRTGSPQGEAIAAGFGAQVPLAFAIRQMAPDGFEVVFEPPADPHSLVDWRGGRPWTQALADAVQPLGLAVTLHDRTLTIARPPSR